MRPSVKIISFAMLALAAILLLQDILLRDEAGNRDAIETIAADLPASTDPGVRDLPPPDEGGPVHDEPVQQQTAVQSAPMTFEAAEAELEALGMEERMAQTADWRHDRGFARLGADGKPLLDQAYEDFDDETLRSYAENGDMWAQQILAERLRDQSPADAINWYTAAAENGSIYAMKRLENFYRKVSSTTLNGMSQESDRYEQLASIKEAASTPEHMAAAWSVVAQMAGGDPANNTHITAHMQNKYSEEEQAGICRTAENLYQQLQPDGSSRSGFDRRAPQFNAGSMHTLSGLPCSGRFTLPAGSIGPDFTGCRETSLMVGSTSQVVTTCGE